MKEEIKEIEQTIDETSKNKHKMSRAEYTLTESKGHKNKALRLKMYGVAAEESCKEIHNAIT